MRVLVTGGAGYIGTVLVRQLLERNEDVTVLDRFDHGWAGLHGASLHGDGLGTLAIVQGDIRDKEAVATAFNIGGGPNAVVHLAAVVGPRACDLDPQEALQVNLHASMDLARRAQEIGARFVFASTGVVYGAVATGVVDERTLPNPQTHYAITKAEAEVGVRAHCPTANILRLATLWGGSYRMRWDLLPHDLLCSALRDQFLSIYQPHAQRYFLYVEDAAAAFRYAIQRGSVTGQILDIGFPQAVEKQEVVRVVERLTHCAVSYDELTTDRDCRDYTCAFTKMHDVGFRPQQPFTMSALAPVHAFARLHVQP